MKNLGVVLSLGALGAAYVGLYQAVDEHHRGLLVFASLAVTVVMQRRRPC